MKKILAYCIITLLIALSPIALGQSGKQQKPDDVPWWAQPITTLDHAAVLELVRKYEDYEQFNNGLYVFCGIPSSRTDRRLWYERNKKTGQLNISSLEIRLLAYLESHG